MFRERELNQAIDNAFGETVEEVAQAMQDNLTASRWSWGRRTRRKNGDVVFSPRNIRDTDELYDSQSVSFSGTQGEIKYTANHAFAVHEGLAEGHDERPWISTTLKENNVAQMFGKNLERRLS